MNENVSVIKEGYTSTYAGGIGHKSLVNIQMRRKSSSEWLTSDFIAAYGEPCAELLPDGRIRFKIGDGIHHWVDLPYAVCGVDDGELT